MFTKEELGGILEMFGRAQVTYTVKEAKPVANLLARVEAEFIKLNTPKLAEEKDGTPEKTK